MEVEVKMEVRRVRPLHRLGVGRSNEAAANSHGSTVLASHHRVVGRSVAAAFGELDQQLLQHACHILIDEFLNVVASESPECGTGTGCRIAFQPRVMCRSLVVSTQPTALLLCQENILYTKCFTPPSRRWWRKHSRFALYRLDLDDPSFIVMAGAVVI